MKSDPIIVLILLAILSISTLTRSLVYLAFKSNIFNVDEFSEHNHIVEKTLTIFANVRLILALVILHLRQLHNDLLTYILVAFVIISIQRVYYQYLILNDKNHKNKLFLDKIQHYTSITVILGSLYIMKYVLF
jgi:hypothetical protein